MNKTAMIVPLALMAMACGGNNSTGDTAPATQAVVDTFRSADLAYADLRGDVSRCVTTSVGLELRDDTLAQPDDAITTTLTQTFDDRGYICQVDTRDLFMGQPVESSTFTFAFGDDGRLTTSGTDMAGRLEVSRDDNGYVRTFTSINGAGGVDYTKVYTWQDGRLLEVQTANDARTAGLVDNITYEYDDQGRCTTEVEESGDPTLQMTVTSTQYAYGDNDDHGNWTSREVRRMARVYNTVGARRVLTDSVATYQRDRRQITYR